MSLLTLTLIGGVSIAALIMAGKSVYQKRRQIAGGADQAEVEDQQVTANVEAAEGEEADTSTVIMRPTKSLRVLSLGLSALALWMIWGPIANSNLLFLPVALVVTAVIFYGALFVANYEARYDEDGITAPNWMFLERSHGWDALEGMGADSKMGYRLRFAGRRNVHMPKHLVGMATFVTFAQDVMELNQAS